MVAVLPVVRVRMMLALAVSEDLVELGPSAGPAMPTVSQEESELMVRKAKASTVKG